MKKLEPLLHALLASFIVYLLCAFYSAGFDISEWSEGCRYSCVILMGLSFSLVTIPRNI